MDIDEISVSREEWEDGTVIYTAQWIKHPGCIMGGSTKEEAIERLKLIEGPYMKFRKKHGLET